MSDVNQATELSNELVEQIMPLLAGHDPRVQGMVVAELMAIWIAGHDPILRDRMMKLQLDAIEELVPLWHEHLRKRRGEA